MKSLRSLVASLTALALSTAPGLAKPRPTPKKSLSEPPPVAAPSPSSEASPDPLIRWLLQQNGGKDSIALPLAEIVRASTDKNILPVDAANPVDAAMIAKLGGVLDRVLPGMNKAESPTHVVGRLDEVAAFSEDALRAAIEAVPGLSCPPAAGEGAPAALCADGFPAFRVLDAASGKSYYLGVTLYPTGGREAAVRALRFHPAEAAARITADGACLLVAIEHNGKIGREIAFLNWELIDLAKLQVHVVTIFESTQGDVHSPGAMLTDGRKGRD